ncbi:methylase [Prauserella marina]|uniref:Release factor glutamine methyltransferase n=1 Tax=Prauserella marina TaxID=530584 RepID=A0A222VQD1_9PSEU|nr:methyltransferase [Prauserella marina]ASR36129.1 methylase [Prauserella marina]PWV76866.1 release factor glutamine methyltransferase [Prauserella marina]SDC99325.1 release factor glutamine methyltransferase [Prauserella marina]
MTGPGFQPTLGADGIARIRRWHEESYQARKNAPATPRTYHYLGLTLTVPPEVMPITPVSHLLGERVAAEAGPGDRVLDMGTGCGVNAILAARAGADVVAVDTNPFAVRAAVANAERNGVGDRVEVRSGDVYSTVEGSFDLMIFDPPFRWFAPRDLAETATTDENYRAMTEFFVGARSRLTARGRLLIFFGTSGDLGYLRALAEDHGFRVETVATGTATRDEVTVGYHTFLMTPS